MIGFNLPVRSYIKYYYYDVVWEDSLWQPKDKAKYGFCVASHYNNEGYLDSLIYRGGPDKPKRSIRFTYDSLGKTGMMYREDVFFEERHTFTWQNKYSYTQLVYNNKGLLKQEFKVGLTNAFREEKGEAIAYNDSGSIIDHIDGYFTFDKDGWLYQNIEKDVINGTTKTSTYRHKQYDGKGIPIFTEVYEEDQKRPVKVFLADITYYD